MNGEGQRPPAPPDTAQNASSDAPEPGNPRFPQPGMNGNGNGSGQFPQGQEGQGGGRRRFRRNRRGGRGRRGKGGGHGQNQVAAPLDAQGRIVDVENDSGEDGGADDGQGEAVQAAPADGAQQLTPPSPGNEAVPAPEAQPQQPPRQQQPQQHRHPQQQQRPQQQPRHEPSQPIEGVLDVDHRGNGRLRSPKYNFLPQQDDPD